MTRTLTFAIAVLSCAAVYGSGADASSDGPAGQIGASVGVFTVYMLTGGTPNPAMNIMGSATATSVAGGMMKIELKVSSLPPNKTYGAHLHKLDCATSMAGGHY